MPTRRTACMPPPAATPNDGLSTPLRDERMSPAAPMMSSFMPRQAASALPSGLPVASVACTWNGTNAYPGPLLASLNVVSPKPLGAAGVGGKSAGFTTKAVSSIG